MVFCRNLLIYLGVPARVCVLAAIDRLLAADGLLFIGHADRLDSAGVEPKFTAVGDPACFVYRPQDAWRRSTVPTTRLTSSVPLSGSVAGRDESSGLERQQAATAMAPPGPPRGLIDTANRAKRCWPSRTAKHRSWTRPPSWPTRGGLTRPSRPASATSGSRASLHRPIT